MTKVCTHDGEMQPMQSCGCTVIVNDLVINDYIIYIRYCVESF